MPSVAMAHASPAYHLGHRFSTKGIASIAAVHAGLFVLLACLDAEPVSPPLATLMVEMIPAAPPPLPAPEALPRPKPAKAEPAPPRRAISQPSKTQPVAAVSEIPAAKEAVPLPQAIAPAAVQPPAAAPAGFDADYPSHPAPAVTPARFGADYLSNPAPSYPSISRRLGEEGRVLLRVFVESDGSPSQIEIKTGSGFSRLDQSALEAVRHWKFIPARRGDESIGAWVQVPIVFNLKG